MPTELISLIGGSATGFLFRYMAEKRAAEQENFKRLLDLNTFNEASREKATKRVASHLLANAKKRENP